ncbi:hypothetical protein [Actinomadura sp. SCN-SB]|uniref:hypothetical protein n=1 Tax=Actinomadura sp. SCN-SB TaxID=3373092 RepID=UPI003751D6EC
MIRLHDAGVAGALGELSWFRREFYQCLTARADGLFELTDAVLCADGPVHTLVACRWSVSTAAVMDRYMPTGPGGGRTSRGCAGSAGGAVAAGR